MEQERINILVNKYLNESISESEKEELMAWYRDMPEELEWLSSNETEDDVKNRIQSAIWAQTLEVPKVKRRSGQIYYIAAAAAAAVLLIAAFISINWLSRTPKELIVEIPEGQTENGFVLLADSSRVVLKPGSSLSYLNDFSGATREVTLIGEAYFDIKKDPNKPFIIHSGDVKTRVLGTAFTIDATDLEKGVQVYVERGKVRVENKDKILAELLANQQLTFNSKTEESIKETAKEEVRAKQIGWTSADMRFDGKAFGVLTEILERRYAVEIVFENSQLANCPVSGTFHGLETLEELLSTLCLTRNATYEIQDAKHILIKGNGCLTDTPISKHLN